MSTPASPVEDWLDALPFRRMTGEGLDQGGTTGDLAWDWDEWDDVVRKDDVRAALQAQDHTITKGGRFDGTAFLDGLSDDEVMYDYPVAASGEPMDPVLFVRWDKVRAALEPTHD